MNPSSQEQWSEIVAMTEAMLHHAEAGEWLELGGLESQRRALIARDLQTPPDGSHIDRYSQVLQRILSLDAQITALARDGHAALSKQLQAIGQGRNAVRAYAQQSS